MDDGIFKGTLTREGGRSFLRAEDGARRLEDEIIWEGYLAHWSGQRVCARRLSKKDYEAGRPIVIMWPDTPAFDTPFIELYFNERLVKYRASFLGHLAVNVNGEIFNFSHKINENEAMKHEEYFFRPALGEFAPHSESGRDNTENPQKPYYDKFGRLFMRTIHVLRITGLDTGRLSQFFHRQLDIIHAAPPDPKRPGYYADFNLFSRNCATIIRDGFRDLGFKRISGVFPRELFVNTAYEFIHHKPPAVAVTRHALRQLSVPEAALSAMPPLLNPQNVFKHRFLEKYYPEKA